MELIKGKDVLLFYVKHIWDYTETYSKRSVSGFYSWYLRLVEALKQEGYAVHENDYELAEQNPQYPIGLVGTPVCIPKWKLPNPAILGPSMYDNPKLNPNLMKDERFKYYILTCQWLKDVFQPYYGDKCMLWNAGIETDVWIDLKNKPKYIDVIIYDKIRWNRERLLPLTLDLIIASLKQKGLTYYVLQYGNVTHEAYKDLLAKSKSMIFLCEHETQGMAYQEALASNLPIVAWDFGYWVDPIWQVYADKPIPATSIPYFSSECGERFKMMDEFENTFEKFWSNLDSYNPRAFVEKHLSLKQSADIYARHYFSLV